MNGVRGTLVGALVVVSGKVRESRDILGLEVA